MASVFHASDDEDHVQVLLGRWPMCRAKRVHLPSARRAYRQGRRWSWMFAYGLKSLRAVVHVSGAGLQQEKWRQDLLELAKHPAWFLFLASGCFKAQTSTRREGAVKAWRRICRWFGWPHGYFCTLATKLMDLRNVCFPRPRRLCTRGHMCLIIKSL